MSHARYRGVFARLLLVASVTIGLMLHGGDRASAHPIGNFTINLYSGIEVSPEHVHIAYVLEMAEISTQEQKAGMDLDEDGVITEAEREGFAERSSAQILTNLHMVANGQPVELSLTDSTMRFRTGQGGLDLLYMQASFDGTLPASGRVEYRDDNYDTRPGWREITVRAEAGVAVTDSVVPDRSISDELKAYPQQLQLSPLDVREAAFSFQPSDVPVESAASPGGQTTTSPGGSGGFADLLATSSDRAAVVLILFAFGFGFIHALGPGHGKTIMAASTLAGSVRVRHTLWLGGGVALMHCASVVALGLIALAATSVISSETVYSGLRVVTAVAVLLVGATLIVVRWKQRQRALGYDDDHPNAHGHAHASVEPRTAGTDRAGLAAVAVSGGLIPSPSAVVVLLGAIAIDRIPMGVTLVVMFSVGLATALIVVGLMSSYAKSWLGRSEGRVAAWLPLASAAAIFAVGLILTVQAVGTVV